MFRRFVFAFVAANVFLVSGCSTMSNAEKGSLAGGLLLGAVGAQIGGGTGQILSALIFGVAGSQMGKAIGESMDYTDKMQAARALEYKKDHDSTPWTNPKSGIYYEVTPVSVRYVSSVPCRDFVIRAKSRYGRQMENVHARACRRNGEWIIQ
jgi:surface antigen